MRKKSQNKIECLTQPEILADGVQTELCLFPLANNEETSRNNEETMKRSNKTVVIDFKSIDTLQEFQKWGDTFVKVSYNQVKDIFLYERRNDYGKLICWEIVKPRIREGVRCYPSSEDFGIYGKCVSATDVLRPKMEDYFLNGW